MLDRAVALKQVFHLPGADAPGQAHERARREARAAARIRHDNVVRILDVVDEDDRLWLVMELVAPARSLADLIESFGALIPRQERDGNDLPPPAQRVHRGRRLVMSGAVAVGAMVFATAFFGTPFSSGAFHRTTPRAAATVVPVPVRPAAVVARPSITPAATTTARAVREVKPTVTPTRRTAAVGRTAPVTPAPQPGAARHPAKGPKHTNVAKPAKPSKPSH